MIITRLKGGLGNQMFLYAIGRHLAIKNKTKLKLDLTYLKLDKIRKYELNNFNINAKVIPMPFGSIILSRITYKILRVLFKHLKKENLYPKQKDYYFDESILKNKRFIIDDYWLGEGYFKDIGDIIRKEFTLKDKLNKENNLMLKKIINLNSICIHIRRGDIAVYERGNEVGRLLGLNYYYNAIKLITKKTKKPHFFIFSDDLDWAKENLEIDLPTTYVGINGPEEGYKDLNLMKHCKHFITANSTFSWWAAWLSENKKKIIITPERWFDKIDEKDIPKNTKKKWPYIRDDGDIIPKSWIRVEN
jgi:hypothetical protein